MSGLVGLHHVQLTSPVGSEEASRWFYGTVLGLPEVAKPAPLAGRGGVWFRSAHLELHLGVEESFRPARKAHPAFAVHDVHAVELAVRTAGFETRWDEAIPDVRRFHCVDGSGNRVEVQQD